MAKFRVTGGEDGQSGISVGSRRYEPGDVVEMTTSKAEWLVERGLLESASQKATAEVEPEPELEDDDDDETVEEVETSQWANLEGDDL